MVKFTAGYSFILKLDKFFAHDVAAPSVDTDINERFAVRELTGAPEAMSMSAESRHRNGETNDILRTVGDAPGSTADFDKLKTGEDF